MNAAAGGGVSLSVHPDRATQARSTQGGSEMKRSYLVLGALALIAVLVIAGCGGSSSSSSTSTSNPRRPHMLIHCELNSPKRAASTRSPARRQFVSAASQQPVR